MSVPGKLSVRIIGGRFRGKKLSFPAIDGLRPTPDRVRETLFNWLMHDIHDAFCLDAFAGSGALGFEACSRGAAHVTLLEKDALAYANLQHQAVAFPSAALTIRKMDALTFLEQTTEQFQIVFLDPPFALDYLPRCVEVLARARVLRPGGLLYMEAPHEVVVNTTLWQPLKLKKAGQIVYGLYRKLDIG